MQFYGMILVSKIYGLDVQEETKLDSILGFNYVGLIWDVFWKCDILVQ